MPAARVLIPSEFRNATDHRNRRPGARTTSEIRTAPAGSHPSTNDRKEPRDHMHSSLPSHPARTSVGALPAGAQVVHAAVIQRVKEGEWPPGHIFTWPQISAEFGVPVRAVGYAMQLRRHDKVVEARPYIGTRVVLPTGEEWGPPGEATSHAQFIEKAVRGRLADGVYAPGTLFPPLRCLAEEFGVSMGTVRSGLRALKEAKILEAVGNTGTFVSGRVRQLSREALLECSSADRERGDPISAYGESMCLYAWAQDPRCRVSFDVLKTRVFAYRWTLERALETPKSDGAKKYSAFGEEKTLKEWAENPRCHVTLKTLRNRIRTGWDAQSAIQSPLLS